MPLRLFRFHASTPRRWWCFESYFRLELIKKLHIFFNEVAHVSWCCSITKRKGGLKIVHHFCVVCVLHRMLNFQKLNDIFHLVAIAWHTKCVLLQTNEREKNYIGALSHTISHAHTHARTHAHAHISIPFCMSRRRCMHWTDKSWKVPCRNRNRSIFYVSHLFLLACYNNNHYYAVNSR